MKDSIAIILLLALVFAGGTALGTLFGGGSADCYDRAVAVAESAVDTTDDLADYTVDTLQGILLGQPHNQSRMDSIAADHHANRADLGAVQDECA